MAQSSGDEADIFRTAREIKVPAAREAYLRGACGDDAALRDRVVALLKIAQDEPNFLEQPPAGIPTIVEPDSEAAGTVIGPYKLLEEIGAGGFGIVYMAEQQAPVRRRVALKIIKPGMDTRQVLARFEAERQALALMDHPNIARALDAGATDSGRPYFVMELVRGIPITHYCDQNNLAVHERLELFATVCRAVQHAHQKGIIHRDIKPSNILVTLLDGRPVPKVIDFGIAKAINQPLTQETLFTRFSEMIGTPLYMSPEQAEMTNLDIDTRSDIYSLGVLLYELLTGTTPFDKNRLKRAAFDEIRRIIREEDPPKPSLRLSTLGEKRTVVAAHRHVDPHHLSQILRGDLDWIVMKALEKDRTRRYETANGLAMDVERHLTDEPVHACPPSAVYRFRKFARRNRAALVTANLVAIALVVGFVVSLWQAIRATQAETLAQTQRRIAQQNADEAREEKQLAKQQELTARRRLYASQINLIDQALERGETGRALALLEAQRAQAPHEDLRGFEWYCLWRLCHQGLVFTLRGHRDRVAAVAFSPDGRTLASGSSDGTVRLWGAASGELRRTLVGRRSAIRSVAFSHDGKLLATASADGTINLWEPETGRNRATWQGHQQAIKCVAFSPDGKTLASASSDQTVKLWDVTSRHERSTLRVPFVTNGQQSKPPEINSVVFSLDGKTLAAGGADWNNLRIWDATTGQERFVLRGHVLDIYAVALSPDGMTLASGGYDQSVKLWDLATGKLKTTLSEQYAIVLSLSFSPDGKTLATGTRDGTVTLWDLATKQKRPNMLGHAAAARSVAFSPDGTTLASAGDDKTVRLWDVTAAQSPAVVPSGSEVAWAVAFSPDGNDLAISHESVQVYDLATRQVRLSLAGSHALGLVYSPDGKTLAASSNLRFVDPSSGREKAALPGHAATEWAVAFSPDGTLLASTSQDHTIKLWDVATARERKTLKGHTDWVVDVKFSPDGQILASASHDQTIKLWDVATGQERATLRGHTRAVWSLAFSPDGQTLFSGGGQIKVWDVKTAKERLTLKGDTSSGRTYRVALSPDGKNLVSAAYNEGLTFWDTASWHERATFKWQRALIRSMAFSNDGKMLATGGEDGTVKLWIAATEDEVRAQSSMPDEKDYRNDLRGTLMEK